MSVTRDFDPNLVIILNSVHLERSNPFFAFHGPNPIKQIVDDCVPFKHVTQRDWEFRVTAEKRYTALA